MPAEVEYTLSNGRKVKFQVEKVQVIDQSETTVTETFSGRPQLRVIGENVIPTAGSIDSETITTTKVWFLKSDGSEEQVDTTAFAVPVRAGHEVALGREVINGKAGPYIGMYNFKTKKFDVDIDHNMKGQRKYGGGRPRGTGWKMVFIGPIIITVIAALFGNNPFLTFPLFVFLGLVLFVATNIFFFDKRQAIVIEVRDKIKQALAAA